MANLSDFLSGGGGTLGELDDVSLRAAIFDQERLTFDDFSESWVNDYGELIIRSMPSGDLYRVQVDDEGNLSTVLIPPRAIRANLLGAGGNPLLDGTDIGLPVDFSTGLSADDLARLTGWELLCMPDAAAVARGAMSRTVSEGQLPGDTFPADGNFRFTEPIFGTYNYRLSLFSADGAHSITEHTVRFFAPPVVTFSPPVFADGNTMVTLGSIVMDQENPAGPFTYVWMRDGSVIAGETGPTLEITNDASNSANGSYTVTVTDPDGRVTVSEPQIVMLNGPLAGSLTHRGSVLINGMSELVATLSDADGPTNIGAWSISRSTGGTPDPANPLHSGTGALDGVTVGSGVFEVTNTGDENVDDVYTLNATDLAATPHTISESVTVDLINMVTVTVNYRLAGSGPGRSISPLSQTFTGIPGTTFSGGTSATVSGTNRFSNIACTSNNPAVTCSTSGQNANISGTYPNTSVTVTVTVTVNSIADLPDLSVSGSGNRFTISNGVANATANWSVSGCGISRSGSVTLNGSGTASVSYNDSMFTSPSCPNSCSVVASASQSGRDGGRGTLRTERSSFPQFNPSCSPPSFPIRCGRGTVNSGGGFSGFGVSYSDCAGTIVPGGWTDILTTTVQYSCNAGGGGSDRLNVSCRQTSGTTGTVGANTGYCNATDSGGRCP